MEKYDNFQLFWDDYSKTKSNEHGFRDWQIAKIIHTSDADYAALVSKNEDKLGFQPMMIVLANPFEQKTKKVLIKNVNDDFAERFKHFSRQQYSKELENRFGSFIPETYNAFTEYDDWDAFDNTWLTRSGKPVFHLNIPLMFDHISDTDYWAKKQSGEKVLEYQRLLITTYFVSQDKFYRFFIKDINDAEYDRIKQLVTGRIQLNIQGLY